MYGLALAILFGQSDQDAAAAAIAVAKARQTVSERARSEADAKKVPLVIFVGVPLRSIKGCVVCRDDDWQDKACVTVHPLGGKQALRFTPNVDDATIRRAAGLDGEPIPAAPFPHKIVQREDLRQDAASLADALADMESYETAKWVQLSTNRSGQGGMSWVPRESVERKWNVPGGLLNASGWQSMLLRGKTNRATVTTTQASDEYLAEITHQRAYDDGAKFAEVLWYGGKVFSVRFAEKQDGKWNRYAAYADTEHEPPGYVRPTTKQCAECHNQAGGGGYGTARIPGGDTVISEQVQEGIYRGEIRPFGGSNSFGRIRRR